MSETPLPPQHGHPERVRYNREKAALSRRTDTDLVASFQLQASVPRHDEQSETWIAVTSRVSGYTMRTLPPMICDGRVWAIYRQLGRPPAKDLSMPLGGIEMDDAVDLTSRTIMSALPRLRTQLLEGRWDPAGGASLTTWFNNLCVMHLPGPWRASRRARALLAIPTEIDPDRVVDADDQPDAVIYDIEFERYVEILDDELGDVVRLDADGFTDAEIAAAVGRTVRSVEYRLTKAHELARRRRERDATRDRFRDIADYTA